MTGTASKLLPRLAVADAAKAIEFYVGAMGAREVERFAHGDAIVHAELALGDAAFAVKDADEVDPAPSGGGASVLLSLDVPDAAALAARMTAAGATVVFPVADHDYGRMGRLADPFGHVWILVETPPPAPDVWSLTDLQTPWCVHTVVTLGIPALLAAGPREPADLAAAAGCDPAALEQVLAYLADRGVFERRDGGYGLGPAGPALLGPEAAFLDLAGIGGRMAQAWSTLPDYVRTGRPGYPAAFGAPFWEDLATHPELAASFDALMGPAGHGAPDGRIELAGGWDGVEHVVDVGGGTGALLAAVLREHPQVHGTLVDLPGTVERSGETLAAVADRVTTAGQSFFDPLPAGADVYLLAKVLNDWPDDGTVAILRRCAEAAGPAGRVVVLGGVSAGDDPAPLVIEMLLLGGRTDPLPRFTELAAQAGLDVVAAGPQPSGKYGVELRSR